LITHDVAFNGAVLIISILMIELIHGLIMMLLSPSSLFNDYDFFTCWISFFFI